MASRAADTLSDYVEQRIQASCQSIIGNKDEGKLFACTSRGANDAVVKFPLCMASSSMDFSSKVPFGWKVVIGLLISTALKFLSSILQKRDRAHVENMLTRNLQQKKGNSSIFQQVHLSFSGSDVAPNPTSVTVMWHTSLSHGCDDINTANGVSRVYFTDQKNNLLHWNETFENSSDFYVASGFCFNYVIDGGFHHLATIRNLESGKMYYYLLSIGEALSDIFEFAIAPVSREEGKNRSMQFSDGTSVSFPSGEQRILFTADIDVLSAEGTPLSLCNRMQHNCINSRVGASAVNRINELAEQGIIDMVFVAGDIGYADFGSDCKCIHNLICWFSTQHRHTTDGKLYEEVWNDFMQEIEPSASRVPFMVSVGNHEAECYDPQCSADPTTLRQLANYAAFRRRYSFNLGKIHFAIICSECNYPGHPSNKLSAVDIEYGQFNGDQLQWLREDLNAANQERAIRPWIVAIGHRPIYTARNADRFGNPTNDDDGIPESGVAKSMQDAFEDIMHENGVNLYLSGHNHGYERTYPVYKGQLTDSSKNVGTVHICSSSGGNRSGLRSYIREEYELDWLAHMDYSTYALSFITIRSDGSLLWTLHRKSDMAIIDELLIEVKR